ncbi:hypothetical protein Salat_0907500 [Sesamum alatum]|uniref:Uncharacterized protein n=1 Tax=Sesamum alatum TaxID=300844 RepID=A0AAE1YK04_9LAMI|nr:hypothetical protein Salat_0907500 [Sesamum alatum]
MLSSVGLEVMNSSNPELNWKTVTKGRRSRKSIARSLNGIAKVGNSASPKRVGDFSGSDSDKFGEAVLGQSTSSKSESVPIKKRRHLHQTPLPHSWTPSLRRQGSLSPRTRSSSPFSEDQEQLPYRNCSSGQRFSNWQLRGVDGSTKVRFGEGFDNIFLCDRTEHEYNDAGDFSGIELLAAAASMDDDTDNAKEDVLVAGDSLMPKDPDASASAEYSKLGLHSDESANSLSNATVGGGNTDCPPALNNSATGSQSTSGSPEEGTMRKVNRQHWDLNTLMDAWDEPYDNSTSGNTSKDVDDVHMEERQKIPGNHVLSTTDGTEDELSNLKIEENKSTTASADRTCSKLPALEEHLPEPPNSSNSKAAEEASDPKEDVGERKPNQVLSCDAHKEASNQVMNTDAILDRSPFAKLRCSSGMTSVEKINTLSSPVAITQDEDCSSNVSECERITPLNRIQTVAQDVTINDMPASDLSESLSNVQRENTKDFQITSALHGTFTQDGRSALIADSKSQNSGTFASGSATADCQGHMEPSELVAKHEDNILPDEGSKRITTEDSCKSCSAGAQCDGPTTSVGKISLAIEARHESDVSQDNHFRMVDGDDLARFQEGYDSPYEDGELRGSFLYSWEDNEMENECVDYESDGRNGDGSDAADYPGSEIVEGGSEGSHGSQRRSSSVKRLPEGTGIKTGPSKDSVRRHFVKDDSENNEIAGRGSNAGSGTTVEQAVEMIIEENDDGINRRQLTDRREAVDVKVTQMDEFASKTGRGKLQSRIEGRSSMEATDEKDLLFIEQCRSRRLGGSYSRPERDTSPDKHLGRYRSATHGERDGVHHWTSWGSRRRFTPSYQGAEGRSHTRPRGIAGDSADKIGGFDYHDPRQTASYLSKGLHRPLVRRPTAERDDYFVVRRRVPPARGASNYRSRGHYSQRAGRDLGEDFDPLPDDAGASVRLPRYLSRRERSFSPGSGRSAHMPLPRRRSRSRSRTRSPRAWHSHRERFLGTRRHSRSPDFRSEARMERVRMPFSKPTFASDFGEGYISPSRGHFSPQRNSRWVDDRTFADNQLRRRRSPMRVFRRTQRFDSVGSSGRLKSDEYFRPMIRPGRFSFMANSGGRECKLESNYDDRRRDDSSEVMHRGLQSDDGGNVRRFRHAAGDDFVTSNLNNEDDVRVTDPRDVPQTQGGGDREDKRASYKM